MKKTLLCLSFSFITIMSYAQIEWAKKFETEWKGNNIVDVITSDDTGIYLFEESKIWGGVNLKGQKYVPEKTDYFIKKLDSKGNLIKSLAIDLTLEGKKYKKQFLNVNLFGDKIIIFFVVRNNKDENTLYADTFDKESLSRIDSKTLCKSNGSSFHTAISPNKKYLSILNKQNVLVFDKLLSESWTREIDINKEWYSLLQTRIDNNGLVYVLLYGPSKTNKNQMEIYRVDKNNSKKHLIDNSKYYNVRNVDEAKYQTYFPTGEKGTRLGSSFGRIKEFGYAINANMFIAPNNDLKFIALYQKDKDSKVGGITSVTIDGESGIKSEEIQNEINSSVFEKHFPEKALAKYKKSLSKGNDRLRRLTYPIDDKNINFKDNGSFTFVTEQYRTHFYDDEQKFKDIFIFNFDKSGKLNSTTRIPRFQDVSDASSFTAGMGTAFTENYTYVYYNDKLSNKDVLDGPYNDIYYGGINPEKFSFFVNKIDNNGNMEKSILHQYSDNDLNMFRPLDCSQLNNGKLFLFQELYKEVKVGITKLD